MLWDNFNFGISESSTCVLIWWANSLAVMQHFSENSLYRKLVKSVQFYGDVQTRVVSMRYSVYVLCIGCPSKNCIFFSNHVDAAV